MRILNKESWELIAQVSPDILLFFQVGPNILLFYFIVKMFVIECTCTYKYKILLSVTQQLCSINSIQ